MFKILVATARYGQRILSHLRPGPKALSDANPPCSTSVGWIKAATKFQLVEISDANFFQ